MRYYLVYITTKDEEEAKKIGRALVAEKLVACVNIIPGMKSIYRWEGKIDRGEETVVIAKTAEDAAEKVVSRVKEVHSYSCPCAVIVPITGGNPEYLQWIGENVN